MSKKPAVYNSWCDHRNHAHHLESHQDSLEDAVFTRWTIRASVVIERSSIEALYSTPVSRSDDGLPSWKISCQKGGWRKRLIWNDHWIYGSFTFIPQEDDLALCNTTTIFTMLENNKQTDNRNRAVPSWGLYSVILQRCFWYNGKLKKIKKGSAVCSSSCRKWTTLVHS